MEAVQLIPDSSFKTSAWSGGVTTELYIHPSGSSYAERRFSFRISTAVVELSESVFTRLEGVKRYLTPLCEGFSLNVCGRQISLPHGEVLAFSGEDDVICRGSGRDLNLMLRNARGNMRIVSGDLTVYDCDFAFVFAEDEVAVTSCDKERVLPAMSFARIAKGDHFFSAPVVLFLIDTEE